MDAITMKRNSVSALIIFGSQSCIKLKRKNNCVYPQRAEKTGWEKVPLGASGNCEEHLSLPLTKFETGIFIVNGLHCSGW